MQEDLIIAGFGGQGIMLIGQLLAYAGLKENKKVLWMPAYGPETRGGFANCTVIFSDEEIGSPVVAHPRSLIVLNLPSLDRFEDALVPGGLLIVNTSLTARDVKRSDIETIKIPATEIATNLGNAKATNMVTLGTYIEKTKIVKMETIKDVLKEKFSGKEKLIELNFKALEKGTEYAKTKVG